MLPLSGPDASLGQALLEAAQLALFELGDERLRLMPRDTEGTPEGSARAVETVLAGGAELILGPLFSASVAAAAPLARERGVNIVAFSTDRSVAGAGVYLMGFMPEHQVERVIAFAHAHGLRRIAALAPDSAYGAAVVNALTRAVARRGAEIAQIEYYSSDAEDAHAPVKRLANYERRRGALMARRRLLKSRDDEVSKRELKRLETLDTIGDLDYDAVLLPDGGAALRAVAPLLPYYDIDPSKVRILGTGLWDETTLGTEPALVGGWFAAPPPASGAAFEKRYDAIYGHTPPRVARLAYDAVALAALLAREAEGANFSADVLTDPSGFAGTGGIFRFTANGLVERGLAVLEVAPRGLKVVGAAPKTFEQLGY